MSDAFMRVCLHVVMLCHVECRGGHCTLVQRTCRLPRKTTNVTTREIRGIQLVPDVATMVTVGIYGIYSVT